MKASTRRTSSIAARARPSPPSARSTRESSARTWPESAESRAALKKFTVAQLIEICAEGGRAISQRPLPSATRATFNRPGEYIETLSATSGLPHVMVRRNMAKIHHALTNMETILGGLTRGLDFSVLDKGFGEAASVFIRRRNASAWSCRAILLR